MKRTIGINELKEKYGDTSHSVKDNSPRGMKTVYTSEIKVGDEVVIDNYFTLVIED